MSRAFKIGDNAKTVQSRTASIANNSNLEPNEDALKIENQTIKAMNGQRVGSSSTSASTKGVDEVGLLKSYLKL